LKNLFCSGDQDSVIPLTGSRTLVHQLAKQLRMNTTVPYRVWFAGQQVNPIVLCWYWTCVKCPTQHRHM